jgi:hypothetical protein
MKLAGFTHNEGKGSASEMLPHRSALTRLAGGDPLKRTVNNYARATPSGANALDAPSIVGMGKSGTTLER